MKRIGIIGGPGMTSLFDLERIAAQQFKIQYMQQIIDLQQSVYEANKAKGFWDDLENRNKGEAVALINSELYESLESHRKGRIATMNLLSLYDDKSIGEVYGIINSSYDKLDNSEFTMFMDDHVKDTFEDELADAVIRILDYTGGFSIKLDTDFAACRQALPANFGEAILQINANVNNTYFSSFKTKYGNDGWKYVLADIVDLAVREKVDLYSHIQWKLKYNANRPHKHGKKY